MQNIDILESDSTFFANNLTLSNSNIQLIYINSIYQIQGQDYEAHLSLSDLHVDSIATSPFWPILLVDDIVSDKVTLELRSSAFNMITGPTITARANINVIIRESTFMNSVGHSY